MIITGRIVHNFMIVQLTIYLLHHGAKVIHTQETPYSNFEFGSFPRLVTCGRILSRDAGQEQLPTSQVVPRVNN